jgi:hypothetical protein
LPELAKEAFHALGGYSLKPCVAYLLCEGGGAKKDRPASFATPLTTSLLRLPQSTEIT